MRLLLACWQPALFRLTSHLQASDQARRHRSTRRVVPASSLEVLRPFSDILRGVRSSQVCLTWQLPPLAFLRPPTAYSSPKVVCLVSCRRHSWGSKSTRPTTGIAPTAAVTRFRPNAVFSTEVETSQPKSGTNLSHANRADSTTTAPTPLEPFTAHDRSHPQEGDPKDTQCSPLPKREPTRRKILVRKHTPGTAERIRQRCERVVFAARHPEECRETLGKPSVTSHRCKHPRVVYENTR